MDVYAEDVEELFVVPTRVEVKGTREGVMVDVDGVDFSFPLPVDEGNGLTTMDGELDKVPPEREWSLNDTVDVVGETLEDDVVVTARSVGDGYVVVRLVRRLHPEKRVKEMRCAARGLSLTTALACESC